jgi:hypothetical protein
MSTDFHTEFGVNDTVTIAEINTRLGELDAGITTQAAAAVGMVAAELYDSKATETHGGASSAATWQTRTLNTEVDPDSIVTLSSNQFTPIAGDYMIWAMAPAYKVNAHRLRLYNVTGASVTHTAGNSYSDSSDAFVTNASLFWIFTANGTDAYRIDHYTESAVSSWGLGRWVGDGAAEVYTQVVLMKFG